MTTFSFGALKKKQKQNRTAKINSLLLSHSYFVAKISVALNFSKKSSVVETHGDMLSQDNEIILWSLKPNCQKFEKKKIYSFLMFHARIVKKLDKIPSFYKFLALSSHSILHLRWIRGHVLLMIKSKTSLQLYKIGKIEPL